MFESAAPISVAEAWAVPAVEPAQVALSPFKRAFDLCAAGFALVFVLPLLLVLATAIWVETGDSVLFKQRRTGLGGRTFLILKLRTMNVAEHHSKLRHATKDDARVTRVGLFLRRSSLDELPQLWNIVCGDMSLVGPRPHALGHDEHYSAQIPEYRERFRARPGLTGLAQVSGLRGEISQLDAMARRVKADLDYIERWSPRLDMDIIIRTFPRLLADPNAY